MEREGSVQTARRPSALRRCGSATEPGRMGGRVSFGAALQVCSPDVSLLSLLSCAPTNLMSRAAVAGPLVIAQCLPTQATSTTAVSALRSLPRVLPPYRCMVHSTGWTLRSAGIRPRSFGRPPARRHRRAPALRPQSRHGGSLPGGVGSGIRGRRRLLCSGAAAAAGRHAVSFRHPDQ